VRSPASLDPHRVLIADDHRLFREGCCAVLASHSGVVVVGQAGRGDAVLELVRQVEWDVLVLDLFLPDRDGLDLVRQIKRWFPDRGVLVLTGASEAHFGVRALRAGADGFLGKDSASAELVAAIGVIAAGDVFASPVLARAMSRTLGGRVGPGAAPTRLTDRELEVVRMVAEGWSQKEIGVRLSISRKTVHTHKVRAQAKLDLDGTAQLIRYALDAGLVGGADVAGSRDRRSSVGFA